MIGRYSTAIRSASTRGFATAVGKIAGPNAIGAIIGFLSTPLLVAWFPPSEFGELGYALAVASILSSIVSLRLEVVIYRVPPAERRSVAWQGTIVTIATATILLCAAGVALAVLPHPRNAARLLAILYLMTIAICIGNIGTAYAIAEGHYLRSGIPKVIIPVVTLLIAAMCHYSRTAVTGAFVLANLASLVLAALLYLRTYAGPIDTALLRATGSLIRRNIRYILFAAPQNSVAIAAFLNSAILLIGWYHGAAAAGLVFLAFRIVGFPSTVLGVAAANLLSSEAHAASARWLQQRFLIMVLAGIAIYGPILLAGLLIPPNILPAEWRSAAAMLAPVTVLCGAQFCIGSFAQLLLIWSRMRALLLWDLARLMVTSLVIVAAADQFTPVATVWLFVMGQMPFYLILAIIVYRCVPTVSAAVD